MVLVFVIGLATRLVPELVAFPYPIGYDVVNYYIPVIANFEEHFDDVFSGQFPLYVVILHATNILINNPALTVSAIAAVAYGLFTISIFYLARVVFKQDLVPSVFLALFVIFQISALRTTWDLHRDIFGLSLMLLSVSAIERAGYLKNNNAILVSLVLVALAASSDKMVGILFALALLFGGIITRRRIIVYAAIASTSILLIWWVTGEYYLTSTSESRFLSDGIERRLEPSRNIEGYSPANLMILFGLFAAYLIPLSVIGFIQLRKGIVVRISTMIAVAASFSWLIFPESNMLAADRWIILAGIFLSIIAGFGILVLARKLDRLHSRILANSLLVGVLVISSATGVSYATLPYDQPFFVLGALRSNVDKFSPVTMQFSSLDVKNTEKMVSSIESVNSRTEQNAIIVGEKHWRGFMEIYLEDERVYRFSDNPQQLFQGLSERTGSAVYLFSFHGNDDLLYTLEKKD